MPLTNEVSVYEIGSRKAVIRKLLRGYAIECYIDGKNVSNSMQINEEDAELIADMFVTDDANSSVFLRD